LSWPSCRKEKDRGGRREKKSDFDFYPFIKPPVRKPLKRKRTKRGEKATLSYPLRGRWASGGGGKSRGLKKEEKRAA